MREEGRKIQEFLRHISQKRGMAISAVAREAGVSHTTLTRMGRANTTYTSSIPTLNKVARVGGYQSYENYVLQQRDALVAVRAYVGAGQAVYVLDNESVLEEVTPPQGHYADGITALIVRGDSMEPQLSDGYILFYKRDCDGVPQECVNRLCVVEIEDNGLLVKNLHAGSKAGHYHLFSKNPSHPPMYDQQLKWAARILDIRPN